MSLSKTIQGKEDDRSCACDAHYIFNIMHVLEKKIVTWVTGLKIKLDNLIICIIDK